MLSKVFSAVTISLDTQLVEVEVEHKNGFPGFDIVGLPDAAIKESRDRIIEAIRHSGYDMRMRRVLCNLAPADIRKNGTVLDLPIALGLLVSSGFLDAELFKNILIIGELGFDGSVRSIRGALPTAMLAKKLKYQKLILPYENFKEVQVIEGIEYFPVKTLNEAVLALKKEIQPSIIDFKFHQDFNFSFDFSEVKGQSLAKRAMEIAAAGFHNIIMIGSPGTGKTMLARRMPSILPPITLDEAIETSKIYSISYQKGVLDKGLITKRPFRSPHHTASEISITGGGSIPKPGEITLAHNGVLFLDELAEFKRTVLEVMRQPLEERTITITRSEKVQTFPANFLFLASMNPCPCGYALHPTKNCTCTPGQIKNYFLKISGPILDRIDLQVQVSEIQFKEIDKTEESSEKIRARVMNASEIQKDRFGKQKYNSQMTPAQIEKYCKLKSSSKKLLQESMEKLGFSMRGYSRILKVSRTIADLNSKNEIEEEHLFEALQYRSLEKQKFSD